MLLSGFYHELFPLWTYFLNIFIFRVQRDEALTASLTAPVNSSLS